MFTEFGFDNLTAPQAAVIFGICIGICFGALAEVTRFCLRRAVVGGAAERRPAQATWLIALAAAILGTQTLVAAGFLDLSQHRFLEPDLPWLAVVAGGLMFGAGMVLARGCASRLTVLAGSGNLRALVVMIVFAIAAHATLKGVLAPLRTTLGQVTLNLGDAASLAQPWAAAFAAAALALAVRARAPLRDVGAAALIGLLVPLAWAGTGTLLFDDFDPIPLQGLSFTAPAAETLFWGVAATAIGPTFGTGLVGGTLVGAAVLALTRRRFAWQSFDSPAQTGRYLLGGALMGTGGVLAGGCTLGAGLSGIPTLSVAAILATIAIVTGAWLTDRLLAARRTEPPLVPAE